MSPTGVALVSGASRGLGAAIVVTWRPRGGRRRSTEPSVAHLFEQIASGLGPATAVVANATGAQPEVALEDLTWRTYLDQFEFFVKSPTLLVPALCPACARPVVVESS